MTSNDLLGTGEPYNPKQAHEDPETEKKTFESSEERSTNSITDNKTVVEVSAKARDLTGQTLDFLSNASNETLGACIVALGATTWLILGRVGLVIIGIVGGVVLHATWERDGQGHTNDGANAMEARRRREKGLDVVTRVLDWRRQTKEDGVLDDAAIGSQRSLDFSDFRPGTGAALTGLTEAVIRDYVKYVEEPEWKRKLERLTCVDGGTVLCCPTMKPFRQLAGRP